MIKKILITVFILLFCSLKFLRAIDLNKINGKYKDQGDYHEFIYFYSNDKFYYLVNLCEAMASVQGNYKIQNNEIICIIQKRGFGEGWGPVDKINEIKLEIINGTIKFITQYGCNVSKDKKFNFEKTKILKSKVDNLRLREFANQTSKIISNLKIGEKVEVIDVDKAEVINSIKGNWLFVKTENRELGYCFSGYLE